MIKIKVVLYLAFTVSFSFNVKSQTFGSANLIDEDVGVISHIQSGDFDSDNFIDIAIVGTNQVAWYRNLNGSGDFEGPFLLQDNLGQSWNLLVDDLDGDDNLDIVVSAFDADLVGWYKGNGDGTFTSIIEIATGLNRASGISLGDLDNDNDLDLVIGVSNGTGLFWVENTDGNGNFGPLLAIDLNIPQARTQAVGDIDGDDDLDILTNSGSGVYLSWFENTDGQGTFSIQHVLDTDVPYENYISMADIDGDNDLDIYSTKGPSAVWRENTDGLGNFGPIQFINTPASGGITPVLPTDLDNDLDRDVLVGSLENYRVGWHENINGMGEFGSVEVIDSTLEFASSIHTIDIDNDGDKDIIVSTVSASNPLELYWFENLTILGLKNVDSISIKLYPNPANDSLKVVGSLQIKSIDIYDIQGRKIRKAIIGDDGIDLSSLKSGMYFLVISHEQGTLTKKIEKK